MRIAFFAKSKRRTQTTRYIAAALERELKTSIAVDPELLGLQVSMASSDITLGHVLEILRDLYKVFWTFEDGVLYLITSETKRDKSKAEIMLMPVESRILPVGEDISAKQFAAAYCHMLASYRGSASVIGDNVILHDVEENLALAEILLEELEKLQDVPPSP